MYNVKSASKAKTFSSNCVGRGVVGGSNIQRKHGAIHGAEIQTKFLLQTFEGKACHLHIISWVRRTRDITGFLSEPSYAMILTKMAKFVTIFRCVYKNISSNFPGELVGRYVGWFVALSDFHFVGVSGPYRASIDDGTI